MLSKFSASTLYQVTSRCAFNFNATFRTRSSTKTGFSYRSEEHTSELQSLRHLVCRLLLEKKNTIIELNSLHTKRQNLFQELDAVIHLLMEANHWGLRKSRNATRLNSRFKSLDTLKVKIISVTFRRVIRTNHKKASKIWRHEIFF